MEVWRVTCIEVCDGGMAGHLNVACLEPQSVGGMAGHLY